MGLEEADRLGTETVDRVRRHFCVTSSVHQQHAELGAGKFICRRPELQCWDGRNAHQSTDMSCETADSPRSGRVCGLVYRTSGKKQQHAELGAGKFICRRPELHVGMGGTQENFTPPEKETEQWK